MGGPCSTYGEKRGVYRVLVWKPDGKRPLGKPRRKGKIILRWIFRKWVVGKWSGSNWFSFLFDGKLRLYD